MTRSAALVLILLIAPLALQAQGTVVGRSHTVLPGETLGEIARQHLGSAAAWERIYEANRDRLADPNRIQVGMVLQIPGAVASPVQSGAVLGVQIGGAPVLVQGGPSYGERRDLLRALPFEPVSSVELDLATRTVFFEAVSQEAVGIQVMVTPPSAVPALSEGVFQAAGWLIDESDRGDRLGEVVGFADAPELRSPVAGIQSYEFVLLRLNGSTRAGEDFLLYELRDPLPGGLQVVAPTGIVRVTEVTEAGAVAQVLQEFSRVVSGQYLTLPRTFPLRAGVHPTASDSGVGARLITFQESKALHFPGDFAFIDRGSSDGVAIGDEFLGRSEAGVEGPQREVARFQVVGVQEGTATVRIVSIAIPGMILPGLSLTLDRKMP